MSSTIHITNSGAKKIFLSTVLSSFVIKYRRMSKFCLRKDDPHYREPPIFFIYSSEQKSWKGHVRGKRSEREAHLQQLAQSSSN